jgi:hypothetical protein
VSKVVTSPRGDQIRFSSQLQEHQESKNSRAVDELKPTREEADDEDACYQIVRQSNLIVNYDFELREISMVSREHAHVVISADLWPGLVDTINRQIMEAERIGLPQSDEFTP